MSSSAFSFADELMINSRLRRDFCAALEQTFGHPESFSYEDSILRFGAEQLVEEMLETEPALMSTKFGVRK